MGHGAAGGQLPCHGGARSGAAHACVRAVRVPLRRRWLLLPLRPPLLPTAGWRRVPRACLPCRGVSKEFKGKDIEKGIAVPTCISVNQ